MSRNQKPSRKGTQVSIRLLKVEEPSGRLHIRRCHVCGGVSECQGKPVSNCTQCGKTIAPFYFFDDQSVEIVTDRELVQNPYAHDGDFRMPIRGLTAYW